MNDAFQISYFESPIGLIQIKSINQKICSVLFVEKQTGALMLDSALNKECIKQLKEYFAGTRQSFELPIFQIGTDFQQKVWNKIYKIPYGDTSTYSLLANNLGNTNSTRTVGAANRSVKSWSRPS